MRDCLGCGGTGKSSLDQSTCKYCNGTGDENNSNIMYSENVSEYIRETQNGMLMVTYVILNAILFGTICFLVMVALEIFK